MQTVGTELKVKGGKLLRARITHDGAAVRKVEITGDFFMHPEEGLQSIEDSMVDMRVKTSAGEIEKLIAGVVEREGIELVGFSPSDLARLVSGALL